jgi:hypothetical protein
MCQVFSELGLNKMTHPIEEARFPEGVSRDFAVQQSDG